MLSPEGMSSPKRAGFLGMKQFHGSGELDASLGKLFHGSGEPDASLGELGSRKSKKYPFAPFLGIFLFS